MHESRSGQTECRRRRAARKEIRKEAVLNRGWQAAWAGRANEEFAAMQDLVIAEPKFPEFG